MARQPFNDFLNDAGPSRGRGRGRDRASFGGSSGRGGGRGRGGGGGRGGTSNHSRGGIGGVGGLYGSRGGRFGKDYSNVPMDYSRLNTQTYIRTDQYTIAPFGPSTDSNSNNGSESSIPRGRGGHRGRSNPRGGIQSRRGGNSSSIGCDIDVVQEEHSLDEENESNDQTSGVSGTITPARGLGYHTPTITSKSSSVPRFGLGSGSKQGLGLASGDSGLGDMKSGTMDKAVRWGGGKAPLFVKAGELFKDGEVDVVKANTERDEKSIQIMPLSNPSAPQMKNLDDTIELEIHPTTSIQSGDNTNVISEILESARAGIEGMEVDDPSTPTTATTTATALNTMIMDTSTTKTKVGLFQVESLENKPKKRAVPFLDECEDQGDQVEGGGDVMGDEREDHIPAFFIDTTGSPPQGRFDFTTSTPTNLTRSGLSGSKKPTRNLDDIDADSPVVVHYGSIEYESLLAAPLGQASDVGGRVSSSGSSGKGQGRVWKKKGESEEIIFKPRTFPEPQPIIVDTSFARRINTTSTSTPLTTSGSKLVPNHNQSNFDHTAPITRVSVNQSTMSRAAKKAAKREKRGRNKRKNRRNRGNGNNDGSRIEGSDIDWGSQGEAGERSMMGIVRLGSDEEMVGYEGRAGDGDDEHVLRDYLEGTLRGMNWGDGQEEEVDPDLDEEAMRRFGRNMSKIARDNNVIDMFGPGDQEEENEDDDDDDDSHWEASSGSINLDDIELEVDDGRSGAQSRDPFGLDEDDEDETDEDDGERDELDTDQDEDEDEDGDGDGDQEEQSWDSTDDDDFHLLATALAEEAMEDEHGRRDIYSDEAVEDEDDEVLGKTGWNDTEWFIRNMEEALEGAAGIKDRKERNKVFRALEMGDFGDDWGINPAVKGKKNQAKYVPVELQDQWEKDRQKKAEKKRQRELDRLLAQIDPTSSFFGGSGGKGMKGKAKGKGKDKGKDKVKSKGKGKIDKARLASIAHLIPKSAAEVAELFDIPSDPDLGSNDEDDEKSEGGGWGKINSRPLFGGKKGKIALALLPKSLADIDEEIRWFLQDKGKTSLSLPPMDKEGRRKVHLLAEAYDLKSKSRGAGSVRFTVLIKTARSGHNIDEDRVERLVTASSYSGGAFYKALYSRGGGGGGVGGGGKGRKGGPARGTGSSARMREGEAVGEGAEKIGVENMGHRLLSKMGWSEGDKIGRTGGLDVPIIAIVKNSKSGLGA